MIPNILTADLLNKIDIKTPDIYDKKKLTYPCFVKPYYAGWV